MTNDKLVINNKSNKIVINEEKNKLLVTSPGPQGPRGRTILSGTGFPASNLGLEGDFYYDTSGTTDFYGPKLTDGSWENSTVIKLIQDPFDVAYTTSWELAQVQYDAVTGYYSVTIVHLLGFYPNVTIKTSAGDVLETGIEYIDMNKIKLTMAQPFAGTAYLS